jgi:hypothetical protein
MIPSIIGYDVGLVWLVEQLGPLALELVVFGADPYASELELDT